MELKKYAEEVLTVLKKNSELEHLMSNLAGDSALAPAKNTIIDIQKRVVKDRLIELTEQYLGKPVVADYDRHKEKKAGKRRRAFIKGISTSAPEGTETDVELTKRQEKKLAKQEVKKDKRKKKLEAELALVNKNE